MRAVPESAGPISPELVLVAPELAAAVAALPDAVLVTPVSRSPGLPSDDAEAGAGAAETVPARAPRAAGGDGTVTPTRYDTRDLLLERHGLTLELVPDGGDHRWRLTLARGEIVEAIAPDGAVPERILALLRAVVGDRSLGRVPVRSERKDVRRLEAQIEKQRRSLVRHDAGARLAADPENLHELRVASRRLRAFLRIARPLVDAAWAEGVASPLRRLGRASGDARDLDVLLEHLQDQAATLDEADRTGAEELIRAARAERDQLQAELVATLDAPEHRGLLDTLGLPVEAAAEAPSTTLEQLASSELAGLLARVRKLGRSPADAQLHALRIRVKRVRYATELHGRPGSGQARRVIAAAVYLQDLLGEHQDAVRAEERLRALALRLGRPEAAFAAGRLAERQARRREALRQRLPRAWRELRRLS